MRKTALGVALAASLGLCGAERTKVLFAFDMEDFVTPESADAVRDLAKTLEAEGVKGHFSTVAWFAKTLVERRRTDVLDALKHHHVGTQTLFHSLHPNITEYTDIEDYAAARERAMREECEGVGMIKAATGHDRLWTSVLPGNGNSVVGLYLYADLGIPFFCGGCGMYDDVTHCGDIWYCNQRHLTYSYEFTVESLTPGNPPVDVKARLDKLAKRKVAVLFMHPCMLCCREFWDGVNYNRGNLCEFGKWKLPKLRSPADRAEFLRRYRDLVRAVKADPRFEITDCPALDAARKPRRAITRADVPAIRAALARRFGPVRQPGEWSVYDVFRATVAFLRGETAFVPDKAYGFLHEPKGVTRNVTVSSADLKRAAAVLPDRGFLPTTIRVGAESLGPADFLFAALEALETGAARVTVSPRDQVGDIRYYLPKMADVNFRGTWIYTPDYRDDWTSNRLRWQFWTFRYEGSPGDGTDELWSRFATPPQAAKLRAWFHWLGDGVTETGLRADIDAMRRLELGGYTIVCAAMFSPEKRNAPVLSDEWKRLVGLSSDLARAAGMETGMHNCPGWTSSGGPWIKPENAMKQVTSAWRDVRDAEGRLTLARPPTSLDFYRDIRTLAFPVEPSPQPVRVTASFACDTAAVARGEADVPLRAWPEDGECSFTFDFGRPWRPRAISVTYAEKTHIWSKAELFASDDGKAFSKVTDLNFVFYHNPATPQTRILTQGKTARFFKVQFRDTPRGVWFKAREPYRLRGISFDAHPVFSGNPGSRYAYRPRPADVRAAVPVVPTEKIVDLTAHLQADGTLALPRRLDGTWRIVRIGYTLTGRKNHPATLAGLECDKLSSKGIDNHWKDYVEKLLALDGAPRELLIDSYEVGDQTWTEGLDETFRRRRGYALEPYLPALAGFAVGSHDATDRFLFDFSRTVAEQMAEHYYGRFAAKCRTAGVRSAVEPYFGPFDGFSAGKDFDVPVGEFWLDTPKDLVRTATSLAHLYGKPFAAAESFSAYRDNGRWRLTPRQLKEETDRAWIRGINRLTVHSYVHQPFTNRLPGVSLGFFGSQFNRNVPWWNEGVAWSRYVARGQALLTAGFPLADVLIFQNETNEYGVPDVPALNAAGFDYDYAGSEIVSQLVAREGEIRFARAPHGYRLLQLGGRRSHWTLATLKRVQALLQDGAAVAGLPPAESPSLADDASAVRALVAEIWGSAQAGTVRTVGRGRLAVTDDPVQALALLGIRAPFVAPAPLVAVSRQVGATRIWFVSNPSGEAVCAPVELAVGPHARTAEFWDAADGSRHRAEMCAAGSGRARIAFDLPPHGSTFIILSPAASAACAPRPLAKTVLREIAEPWRVTFAGLAAPTGIYTFAKPVSWSERPEPSVRAFSGRATYRTAFRLPAAEGRLWLDLGDVRDVARVRVNGREAGIAWMPPYRVEVTGLVASGENRLELEVANNWPNRLIGDARARAKGGKGVTWTNYGNAWRADEPFIPAGLLGPVRLLKD